MELTLEAYANERNQWYIKKYGCLDYHYYTDGLYYIIANYARMNGKFSDADVEFINRTEFQPEDFITVQND